jgi:hypothetical protein
MKTIISLFVEFPRTPGGYQVFHYKTDKIAINWCKLPINFIDAVKVLEANKCENIKTITAEEIAINNVEFWVVIFFSPDHEFQRVNEYKLT